MNSCDCDDVSVEGVVDDEYVGFRYALCTGCYELRYVEVICGRAKHERRTDYSDGNAADSLMYTCRRCRTEVCVNCGTRAVNGPMQFCDQCADEEKLLADLI